jgi:hypothetical protein
MEEIVKMKADAENLRLKRLSMEEQLGKQLVLSWTEEDQALSLSDWDNDLRIGVVRTYIVPTEEFMIRFKCGYEKHVSADALIGLVEENNTFLAAKRVKTKRSVAVANKEWDDFLDDLHGQYSPVGSPTQKPTKDVVPDPLPVHGGLEDKFATERARWLRILSLDPTTKPNDSVLDMQLAEAKETQRIQLAEEAEELQKALKEKEEQDGQERVHRQQQEEKRLKELKEKEVQDEQERVQRQQQEEKRLKELKEKEMQDEQERVQGQQQEEKRLKELKEKEVQDEQERVQRQQQEDQQRQQQEDQRQRELKDKEEDQRLKQLKETQEKSGEEPVQRKQGEEQSQTVLKEKEVQDEEQGAGTTFKDLLEGREGMGRYTVPPPPSTTPPGVEDEQELFKLFLAERKMQSEGTKGARPTSARKSSEPSKKKRKVGRRPAKFKKQKETHGGEEAESDDEDGEDVFGNWGVEYVPQTGNTARRILWQRGHAATTPSKIRELVEQATVKRVEDALEPLQTIGFAILDDISEAFAPRNRCTKEQRDFIKKCTFLSQCRAIPTYSNT